MNIERYARWLREQRAAIRPKFSQHELARQAGVSHTYIAKLEAGTVTEPGMDKIDRISRVLQQYRQVPLVNDARKALGVHLLADEDDVTLAPPTASDDIAGRTYRIVEQLKGLAREVQSLPDPYKRLVKVAVGDDLHFRHRAEPNEETEQGSSSCRALAYA